jgi:hypothetical protein
MRNGEGSAPWIDVSDGVLDSRDQSSRSRDSERIAPAPPVKTRVDWGLLVLTGIMVIPFALVAWLMS